MLPLAFDKWVQCKRNVRNNDKQKRKAHQALREIMAMGKKENSAGVMELSEAHIIDLMHAVSFSSFKGNRQWIKGPVMTKYWEGRRVMGMKMSRPVG